MVATEAGFSIPKIDSSMCIECGACMKACHKITPRLEFHRPLRNLACWTKNSNDRRNSSSGGAFSIIAKEILRQGGVVFGATMTADLKVCHIAIDRIEDIMLLQGSKYVQSDMGTVCKDVKAFLSSGRKVLFTGTPCQVASILTYLKKKPENLYTCDLVCHGVPSQAAFDIYIDRIGVRRKSKNFNFRFTEGWGFQLSRQTVALDHRKPSRKYLISPKDSYYLRAFTKALMFSEACYTCPYARPERISDFTLADYWGLGTVKPFDRPTAGGISCMLVNTDQAKELISSCRELEYEERPLEESIKGNHNLSNTSFRPQGRNSYFDDSVALPLPELYKKYQIGASSRDYLRIIKQLIIKYRAKMGKLCISPFRRKHQ